MTAVRKRPPIAGTLPLHVAFTQSVSRRLYAAAELRGVKPSVLVGAVMKLVTDDDSLLDAVLDGEDASALAPGFAFLLNGLTRRQGAVLYIIATHSDCYAVSRLFESDIARLMPETSANTIYNALVALADRGLIARVDGVERCRPYSLTEEGWRVAKTLGVSRSPTGGEA